MHALVSIELVVVLVEKRMHSKLQEVAPVHQLGDGHHLETGHLLSGGGSDKEVRFGYFWISTEQLNNLNQ